MNWFWPENRRALTLASLQHLDSRHHPAGLGEIPPSAMGARLLREAGSSVSQAGMRGRERRGGQGLSPLLLPSTRILRRVRLPLLWVWLPLVPREHKVHKSERWVCV